MRCRIGGHFFRFTGCLMLLLGVCTFSMRAQSGSQGSIAITVLDPSGSVIPAAHLELTDLATNDVRAAETQDRGTYTFVNLNIGTYKLAITKDGFATRVFDSIVVHAGQVTPLAATLSLGQATQTVTVAESATPVMETTSNQIGTVVDLKQIQDLPVGDRDLHSLAYLTP